MGLDVYLVHADPVEEGSSILIRDDRLERFAHMSQYLEPTEVEETDWDATFASHGMSCDDYELREVTLTGRSACPRFRFVSKSERGLEVDFEERRRALGWLLDRRKAPRIVRGRFLKRMASRMAVSGTAVSAFRDGANEAFFDHYRPDDLDAGAGAIERMASFVLPEAEPSFKRHVADLWDPARSFLVISW